MKAILGQALLALAIGGAGAVSWRAGEVAGRMADAQQELALLRYSAPADEYGDIEDSVGYARLVPWVTNGVLSEVRRQRSSAEYWQARYTTMSLRRDTHGVVLEEDPALLLLAANASYRASQRDSADRQGLLHGLDVTLKSYADVLKKNPDLVDAAYNYEYVSRQRDALAKNRPPKPGDAAAARTVRKPAAEGTILMAGDLPDGPTVHGHPGAPPPNADMSQFKLHVPVRPEERKAGEDAGKGGPKVRKG